MQIDTITNHSDLFTKIYDRVRKIKTRFAVVYGGASSSKSYSVHQNEIFNLFEPSKGDTLFIRKYATDLYDSCYKLCQNLAKEYDLYNSINWAYSNSKRQADYSGKRLLFRGLDDKAKIKSLVGVKRIIVEEAEQITKEDFLELNRRARGIEDIQIILILNPVDERHWIKEHFFDNQKVRNKTTIIHATYKDNIQNLTKQDVEELEDLQLISPNDYRIYALGQWGKPEVKRPYVYNFDTARHISESAKFSEISPIYFSIDFNLEPLVCTCSHIWNDSKGAHWHIFKEIVLELGSVEELCDRIEGSFKPHTLASSLFTGDATGRKRDVISMNNVDAWTIIDKRFNLRRRLQVPRSNPIVKENRHLMNALFAMHPDIKINPDCKLTINEIQYTEASPEGDILKKDRNKLEQRADALDTVRYAANTWLRDFITNRYKYQAN